MKMRLEFPAKIIRKPIVSEICLNTGVLINLERVNIEATWATMIVDVEEKIEEVTKAFEEKGVEVEILEEPIKRDDGRCVHCGICSSICAMGVFSFGEDRRVEMDPSRCIVCKNCIELCPTAALEIY